MVPKVYLDTSVISYVLQKDSPEKSNTTREFFRTASEGGYELFATEIALVEFSRCQEPKRSEVVTYLKTIQYRLEFVARHQGVQYLASLMESRRVLPNRCRVDLLHIAAAVVFGCDILLTWDQKHLANDTTRRRLKELGISIRILTPDELKEG